MFAVWTWSLVLAMTRREIEQRYKGSFGGILWYVIQTLLSVAIYSLVFGAIFSARWAETGREPTSFTMAMFLGLLVFNIFSECIQRSAGLIVGNANYVKKLVFPLEILPLVALGAALFNMGVGLVIFFLLAAFMEIPLHWSALLLPVILAPFAVLILGLMWLLASLGTFVRDASHVIGLFVTLSMFLSPLFYPSAVLPEGLRPFTALNPVTLPMEMSRNAVLFGEAPDPLLYLVYCFVALIVCGIGYWWFQSTRKGFADVL
jgi:lipopolysaccharide transport system permease protein